MRYCSKFPWYIPHSRVGSYVFRTRSPLEIAPPLDLHVLGIPPAFNLSQDQTLHFKVEEMSIVALTMLALLLTLNDVFHYARESHQKRPHKLLVRLVLKELGDLAPLRFRVGVTWEYESYGFSQGRQHVPAKNFLSY